MLRKDVVMDGLQLSMMGFIPCPDADLTTKTDCVYEGSHVILTRLDIHYLFAREGEDGYKYVQDLAPPSPPRMKEANFNLCTCHPKTHANVIFCGVEKVEDHELGSLDRFYCVTCNSFWMEP